MAAQCDREVADEISLRRLALPAVSDAAVQRFWQRFRETKPSAPDSPDSVWFFRDSAPLAAELAGLVAAGTKTATACLVWEYEAAREAIPRAGRFSVVTTFAGQPIFVLETTGVVVQPFDAVDERFAFDEGKGDRSLASRPKGSGSPSARPPSYTPRRAPPRPGRRRCTS